MTESQGRRPLDDQALNRPDAPTRVGAPIRKPEGGGDCAVEEATANTSRTTRKRGRGRPRKVWIIHVKAIDPGKYPELERNPMNPFSYLDPEARTEEILSFCAQLWARTCQDIVRRQFAAKKAEQRPPQSSPTDSSSTPP